MSNLAPTPGADLGVIGGSGLYDFFDDPVTVEVQTPYGSPSAAVTLGEVAGRRVAFLPRHGLRHEFPAHRVPYQANLWALRALGVGQVLAPCAVGSLRGDLGAGAMVIPDQLVDRTTSRPQTYYDDGAVHVGFADPYCPVGRRVAVRAGATLQVVDGATMVVIEGPRFSTRAESRAYAAQGWDLVNMTGVPEAVLARELALCYTAVALVTDLDAGLAEGSGVSQEEVFATFASHLPRMRELLTRILGGLPSQRRCPCPGTLDGMQLPFPLPGRPG